MPRRQIDNNGRNTIGVDENGDSLVETSNNNADSNNNGYISANRSTKKPNKIYSNDDNANEDAESWQILDADEDSVRHDNDKNIRSDSIGTNYIEISPRVEDYSPALVKICAALYAILPLAGYIAVHYLLFLIFTRHWFVTIFYIIYLLLDKQSCNTGGWRIDFVYNSKFWSYLAAHFPVKLRYSKNFRLNPSENYILNYHPHGIAAFGVVTTFATNGLGFRNLFPNITARFMVHESSFMIPIIREVFTLRGDCSVNSNSFDYLLTKSKGNLLTLICGGLAEADLSRPDELKVVIRARKGFVKKAMIHGANIIPCIGFGENSVFKKVDFAPSSFMHRLQDKWYELFKFKHPIYYGQSLFSSKRKGFMPYKKPITVVMGDPIIIEKNENPTQMQIEQAHATYLKSLKELYDSNKDLCKEYDKTLILV